MANGRLEKVKLMNDADKRTKIKREFFLTKTIFNDIVDAVRESEGLDSSFSAWVFDACMKKLACVKAERNYDEDEM